MHPDRYPHLLEEGTAVANIFGPVPILPERPAGRNLFPAIRDLR